MRVVFPYKSLTVCLAGFKLWLPQECFVVSCGAVCVRLKLGTASPFLPSGDTLVLSGKFGGVKLIVKITILAIQIRTS